MIIFVTRYQKKTCCNAAHRCIKLGQAAKKIKHRKVYESLVKRECYKNNFFIKSFFYNTFF